MSRTRLLIGTTNRHKAAEIARILQELAVEVCAFGDPGIGREVPAVEETGETFAQNAALKATAFARATGLVTLADDSGLCVDALAGAPGVFSARYAGPGATDAANNAKLLAALADTRPHQRGARFCCALALADADGTVRLAVEGHVNGTILHAAQGTGGFGYDPIFFHPPSGCTFAELHADKKTERSHRAAALAAFRPRFAELIRAQL